MTSSSSVPRTAMIVAFDEAEQAFQIAVSELGQAAEHPAIRDLLRVTINSGIERGTTDPVVLAHAAVDEVVLVTGGSVRPPMTN